MKIEEAKEMVEKIAGYADDDETAHAMEDELYHDFITYVSNGGKKDLQKIAKIIKKTEGFDFARWVA